MSTGPIHEVTPDPEWRARIEGKLEQHGQQLKEILTHVRGDTLGEHRGANERLNQHDSQIKSLQDWRNWIVATGTALALYVAASPLAAVASRIVSHK